MIIDDLESAQSIEEIEALIKNKFNLNFSDILSHLSASVLTRASELANTFVSIVPYNDYGKYMEDPDEMSQFIANEVSKIENWKFEELYFAGENNSLLEFIFASLAIGDGNECKGYVFVDENGKIKHSFAQNED